MNKNTAGPAEPIYDSRNSDEPPRMSDKCPHGWTTPPECPSCMAIELDALRDSDIQLHARNEMLFSELESLRQENSRLREALEQIVKEGRYPGSSRLTAHIAEEALNPPKS